MSLSFAVMVFWSDRTVIQPDAVEAPGSWRTWNFPVMCSGPPPRMVTLETCQLVVTWQHCWHGNDVEKLKLCMDYGQSIYGNLSIALLQKNDTGVSPRYSYKLFLYLLFYIPEKWQILPCFLMFYSFFFFFSFLNDHRSNNPFQVVYFFSNKIYNLPIFENCLVFGYGLLSLYTL